MIEKERVEEANRNVKQYINEGLLKVKDKDAQKFVAFFMKNAESSLERLRFFKRFLMRRLSRAR